MHDGGHNKKPKHPFDNNKKKTTNDRLDPSTHQKNARNESTEKRVASNLDQIVVVVVSVCRTIWFVLFAYRDFENVSTTFFFIAFHIIPHIWWIWSAYDVQ